MQKIKFCNLFKSKFWDENLQNKKIMQKIKFCNLFKSKIWGGN